MVSQYEKGEVIYGLFCNEQESVVKQQVVYSRRQSLGQPVPRGRARKKSTYVEERKASRGTII